MNTTTITLKTKKTCLAQLDEFKLRKKGKGKESWYFTKYPLANTLFLAIFPLTHTLWGSIKCKEALNPKKARLFRGRFFWVLSRLYISRRANNINTTLYYC